MNVIKILLIISVFLLGLISPAQTSSINRKKIEGEFKIWLINLKKDAISRGISKKAIDQALKGIKLKWKLPDLNIPRSKPKKIKRQPEFASPGKYFPKKYLHTLSVQSSKIYKKLSKDLIEIEKKYNVDARIVLSVWGRETSFGQYKLPYYAIEVLATQAFIGRRKEYFRKELLAGLQILDQGHTSPSEMKSSWAGAMGHTQFMPQDFEQYAVDHDGDGRRDIWNNTLDALASTANYLAQNGWQKSYPWGYEVILPKNFDCRMEGFDKGRTITEWRKLGITIVQNTIFSEKQNKHKTYLLIPGGTKGPAFLVTDNFLVIKTYNQANLYALFVGHVADRTTNNKPFIGQWPKLRTFSRDHMRQVQKKLAEIGYDIGKIDGIIGPKSRSIIGDFQTTHMLKASCYPDKKFFNYLLKVHKTATRQ